MIDLTPSLSITISLITASVLSLSFNSTRSIGIICVTALCYFYPFFVMPPVLIGTVYLCLVAWVHCSPFVLMTKAAI